MKIIAGNSNRELAEKIAEHCFTDLVPAKIDTFADGECNVEFHENIRGEDVFIIQSTSSPVNDSLMELMIMIALEERSSLQRVLNSKCPILVMQDKIERVHHVHLLLQNLYRTYLLKQVQIES